MTTLRLLLGDQLNLDHSWLREPQPDYETDASALKR